MNKTYLLAVSFIFLCCSDSKKTKNEPGGPAGYDLSKPEKFTMPELQRLYETVLDKPLDRRNFQKKVLNVGILERLKERKTGGAHKAPYLYRFDKKKYEKAMKQGLKFGF